MRRRTDTLRASLTLAIIPVAPALGLLGSLAVPPIWRDEVFSMAVLATLVAQTACLVIWLRVIRWTLGRVFGTTSATAVVLVHLALWQPVWDVGCVNDALITGQSLTVFGLWMWILPVIWWSASGRFERVVRAGGILVRRTIQMRGVSVSLMRAVGVVPLVCGVWAMTFLILEDVTGWSDRVTWTIANTLGASVLAAGWVLAWRRGVIWRPDRRRETLLLCVGLVLVSGASGIIESRTDWIDSLRINLPLFLAGAFMALTARSWCEVTGSRTQDEAQPYCPACGYNMTGLQQARCPECGESYTLDELFTANTVTG